MVDGGGWVEAGGRWRRQSETERAAGRERAGYWRYE